MIVSPSRTQSSPCLNSNAQCCYIIFYLLFRRQKCKRLIISASWPHFLRTVILIFLLVYDLLSWSYFSAHMDYIFLQFNAEMNQIVYSGRYRVTGAYMGSCAREVALELQRDPNLLLFCRCGFLSSRERPNRCIFFSMFLFFHCCH